MLKKALLIKKLKSIITNKIRKPMYYLLEQEDEDLTFEQFIMSQEDNEEIIEETQLMNDVWY